MFRRFECALVTVLALVINVGAVASSEVFEVNPDLLGAEVTSLKPHRVYSHISELTGERESSIALPANECPIDDALSWEFETLYPNYQNRMQSRSAIKSKDGVALASWPIDVKSVLSGNYFGLSNEDKFERAIFENADNTIVDLNSLSNHETQALLESIRMKMRAKGLDDKHPIRWGWSKLSEDKAKNSRTVLRVLNIDGRGGLAVCAEVDGKLQLLPRKIENPIEYVWANEEGELASSQVYEIYTNLDGHRGWFAFLGMGAKPDSKDKIEIWPLLYETVLPAGYFSSEFARTSHNAQIELALVDNSSGLSDWKVSTPAKATLLVNSSTRQFAQHTASGWKWGSGYVTNPEKVTSNPGHSKPRRPSARSSRAGFATNVSQGKIVMYRFLGGGMVSIDYGPPEPYRTVNGREIILNKSRTRIRFKTPIR